MMIMMMMIMMTNRDPIHNYSVKNALIHVLVAMLEDVANVSMLYVATVVLVCVTNVETMAKVYVAVMESVIHAMLI